MFKKILFSIIFIFFFSSISYAQSSSFYTYLERCEDLRSDIEEILNEEGLPDYFFYLALAESGCKPDNKSHKNALGLFQIIPSTFRIYSKGICTEEKSCPVSEAYDPLVSTRVAARYLKSLYERFDHNVDWTIASYHSGGTNLKRKTHYKKGMDIKIVAKVDPPAYNLAMKVKRFSVWDDTLKEKENL